MSIHTELMLAVPGEKVLGGSLGVSSPVLKESNVVSSFTTYGVHAEPEAPADGILQLKKNLSQLESLQSRMLFMIDEIQGLVLKS